MARRPRLLVQLAVLGVLVAVLGVVTPIALGWAAAAWLLPEGPVLAHLFVGATLAAPGIARAQGAQQLAIATGTTGGVYYPLGGGMAAIFSRAELGLPPTDLAF